jgi:hypothetical protein
VRGDEPIIRMQTDQLSEAATPSKSAEVVFVNIDDRPEAPE